jgi:hypothetical protein
MIVRNKIKKNKFITDAFLGALQKNEEMNGDLVVRTDESKPTGDTITGVFTTDAFVEALKINEERNKSDNESQKNTPPANISEDAEVTADEEN